MNLIAFVSLCAFLEVQFSSNGTDFRFRFHRLNLNKSIHFHKFRFV